MVTALLLRQWGVCHWGRWGWVRRASCSSANGRMYGRMERAGWERKTFSSGLSCSREFHLGKWPSAYWTHWNTTQRLRRLLYLSLPRKAPLSAPPEGLCFCSWILIYNAANVCVCVWLVRLFPSLDLSGLPPTWLRLFGVHPRTPAHPLTGCSQKGSLTAAWM